MTEIREIINRDTYVIFVDHEGVVDHVLIYESNRSVKPVSKTLDQLHNHVQRAIFRAISRFTQHGH